MNSPTSSNGEAYVVRPERAGDASSISIVIERAFAQAPHADGTEAYIVSALRDAGALTLSLVAELEEKIVGHVAFSPVTIEGQAESWYGLGPVAVDPSHQSAGIGAALIGAGLSRLREAGARGCVVLGDPAYYGRFGFLSGQGLVYPGPPSAYFQSLAFTASPPKGVVAYHPAFTAG